MSVPDLVGYTQPTSGSLTSREQVALAVAAEEAGFDFTLVPETWGREAFTRLGYIASQTDRIALGTGILPVHSRSPALIAQSIATLAELTDRRTILGIGLSSNHVIEQWHGIEFEPALRRERETIEIARRVLDGKEIDYEGRVFDVEHFRLRFTPPDVEIPIYVAAWGEKNCELTGGFADGWLPNHIPVSRIDELRETVDYGAEKHGRDPREIVTIPYATACVLEDGTRAKELCREEIAFYIGAMGEYTFRTLKDHGYEAEAMAVRERWESEDKAGAIEAVTDELLREVTVSGTPDEARDILEEYDMVADGVTILPTKAADGAALRETIDHLGSLL